jgi:hypothetical protein
MLMRRFVIVAALCLCGTSASALTMPECSAKYKAAPAAGTLKGQSWAVFRRAECGPDASPAAVPATPAAAPAPLRPAAGGATFPSAISSKYSNESPGKARLHTCLDQYTANKANNANGGMSWIQKGGGYYSDCNRRLKG